MLALAPRLAAAQPAPAPEPLPSPEVEALRAEVEALRAQVVAEIEAAAARTRDAEQAAAAERARVDALADELAAERGARLETARAAAAEAPSVTVTAGKVRFGLSLFVQVDAVVLDQGSSDELDPSTRAPLNQDRILLRRGRVRLDVDGGLVGALLELDANTIDGPATRVIGAEVHARVPWKHADAPELEGVAGLFRIPFGLETRQTYRDRLFLEPGHAVRALFPGDYDLGLGMRGSWRWLRGQVAVMNGQPTGARAFPGVDPNRAKEVVGRLAVAVGRTASRPGHVSAEAHGLGIEVGVSAIAGDGMHPGTETTKDTLVWRDANEDGAVQLSELQIIAGSPATPSVMFDRFAIGADLRVVGAFGEVGEVVVYGEAIHAENMDRGLFVADPVSAGRDLRELGVMAGVTWEAPFGAVAGIRYDRYDPDVDAFELQAGEVVPREQLVSTLAIAAGWRLRGSGRVLVEYDHERNPFGRDAGAEPTSRADDRLTLRVEAAF